MGLAPVRDLVARLLLACRWGLGWWTRLSGMYVFCKHLGAASACGTDKSPASAMCFVTRSATASACKTVEQAVCNACIVTVSAAASTCRTCER